MLEAVPARLRALAPILVAAATFIAAPAAHAGKAGGTTAGGKGDRTAPSVAISAPTAGATVNGQTSLQGSASDNVAVAKMEISLDGGAYAPATGTTTWSSPLNTASLANGGHTVSARATDSSGNASLASVTFTVANAAADTTAPSVAISSPATGASVGHQISLSGSASDNTGVASVAVKLDGGAYATASGTGAWTASVDAAAASEGQHVLTVRALDAAGNAATASVTVTIVREQAVGAPAMAAGTIGGFLFQESDRDGLFETTETPLASQNVYLYNGAGQFVTNVYTNASGWYQFSGRANGTYTVKIAPSSWTSLEDNWVPDTTGSLQPSITFGLSGTAREDVGLRPIVRSTDANAPISAYVGASGVTVKSYDDVVSAREVHDRLITGSLIGAEAQSITIRFDYRTSGMTTSRTTQDNGVYTDFDATSDITWSLWLSGDNELFHEYGHAWSLYYANMVQHDPTFAGYLQARGLTGDPRLGSSYAWDVKEMIAEDYRQLFGTPSAAAGQQLNQSIPRASDVPGLANYLSTTFRH